MAVYAHSKTTNKLVNEAANDIILIATDENIFYLPAT